MWKKANQTYWLENPFESVAFAGIQVKVVDSDKGPSTHLRNALWRTGNTDASEHLVGPSPPPLSLFLYLPLSLISPYSFSLSLSTGKC